MDINLFIEKVKANLSPEDKKYIEFSSETNSNNSISVSVTYYNRLFVNSPVKSLLLRYNKKKLVESTISVRSTFEKLLIKSGLSFQKAKDGMLVVSESDFDSNFEFSVIREFIYALFPVEPFGCCGKYVKCSDARACLHDDLVYASGCMYRSNLEHGRIFYGKNKNV